VPICYILYSHITTFGRKSLADERITNSSEELQDNPRFGTLILPGLAVFSDTTTEVCNGSFLEETKH